LYRRSGVAAPGRFLFVLDLASYYSEVAALK